MPGSLAPLVDVTWHARSGISREQEREENLRKYLRYLEVPGSHQSHATASHRCWGRKRLSQQCTLVRHGQTPTHRTAMSDCRSIDPPFTTPTDRQSYDSPISRVWDCILSRSRETSAFLLPPGPNRGTLVKPKRHGSLYNLPRFVLL